MKIQLQRLRLIKSILIYSTQPRTENDTANQLKTFTPTDNTKELTHNFK
jgi:hypothetical protein